MQFSIATLTMAMLALRAQAGVISARETDATINLYNSANCQNYQTTITWVDEHGANGGCYAVSAGSVDVTSLFGSCTVTVYTDSSCSSGATAARANQCVSGSWKAFSVDSCA